jgi:hypothetical protein
MSDDEQEICIGSRDFWVKLVEMLQQNWALIEETEKSCRVWFLTDCGGVFDEMDFADRAEAERSLIRNGFCRYVDNPNLSTFLDLPQPPYRRGEHMNGRIYSSGRFWD